MTQPVTADGLRNRTASPGSVDPNVKIPRHVLEAGKRSEEIQRRVFGTAEPSVAENMVKAAGEPVPPGTTVPVPMEPGMPVPPQEPVTPPSNEPPAPPQAAAPAEPVDWEQRYKRLHGRHEADTKRNREAIAQLSERVEQLSRENGALAARGAAPAPAQVESLLSEQEIQDFGPELVDVMRRVAAEVAAPLNAELHTLRSGLGQVQQETGNSFVTRMNTEIGAAVPNWATLNKTPEFIAWSQLPDVFSGAIRKQLMQEAWNSGDAPRVVAFFRAFLAEEAATNPQGGNPQPRPAPRTVVTSEPTLIPPAQPAPALDLSTLAAPGRAHSAGGQPAEKPVYTSADITRFYTEVASGKWRGREAQRAAIDADIAQAQHEGRIIQDQRNVLPRDQYAR